jgi:hypothetical protein
MYTLLYVTARTHLPDKQALRWDKLDCVERRWCEGVETRMCIISILLLSEQKYHLMNLRYNIWGNSKGGLSY